MTPKQLQQHAASLMKSGMLEEITEALRRSAFLQWMSTTPEQTERREQLYYQMRALDNLMGSVENLAVEEDKFTDPL